MNARQPSLQKLNKLLICDKKWSFWNLWLNQCLWEGDTGQTPLQKGFLSQFQWFFHWILMKLSRTAWTPWRMEPNQFSGKKLNLEHFLRAQFRAQFWLYFIETLLAGQIKSVLLEIYEPHSSNLLVVIGWLVYYEKLELYSFSTKSAKEGEQSGKGARKFTNFKNWKPVYWFFWNLIN